MFDFKTAAARARADLEAKQSRLNETKDKREKLSEELYKAACQAKFTENWNYLAIRQGIIVVLAFGRRNLQIEPDEYGTFRIVEFRYDAPVPNGIYVTHATNSEVAEAIAQWAVSL